MSRIAETSVPIVDALATRWSPRSFDQDAVVTADDLTASFEAARWSPSANNLQPWSFVAGYRGDAQFSAIAENLAGYNAAWAPRAAALIVNLAQTEGADGTPNKFAQYDLGQAVAHFSVQATADGYFVHQMGGFDAAVIADKLGIDAPWQIVSVMAVGPRGEADELPEPLAAREVQPRSRKPLAEVVR
ncbi:MAG: hypothetical protein RL431_213 [Actinomycetota bacterium]|jgi:nitroreductase